VFSLLRITGIVLAAVFVAVFTVSNYQPVALHLFPLPITLSASLSVLILGAFLGGAIVGGFLVSFRAFSSRMKLRKANKKIKQLETRPSISSNAQMPDGQMPLPLRFR
jgi:uncharacterized integral membrane protein